MDINFGYKQKKSCALNSLFVVIALIVLTGLSSSLFAQGTTRCSGSGAEAVKLDLKPAGQFPNATE